MPVPSSTSRTLYDKIWDEHVVHVQDNGLTLLYADRHLVHEVASNFAFEGLRTSGRTVRRRDCTLATIDHNVPTSPRNDFSTLEEYISDVESRAQCITLEQNAKEYGLVLFGVKDRRQGIVHIIGPEQGFTLPGSTIVCGDSHTSTHGAFGALAFGIGTTEVEHVLATQTILQRKSKNMRVRVDGTLHEGVTAKDVILHIIGVIGTAGGTGCVIEYAGSVFRSFSMEARMSVCNMSIEAGARAGMVAPDETTFEYLKGRPLAPKGEQWDQAVAYWRTLKSDEDAIFDREVLIKAEDIVPTVTWGNSPQDVAPITGFVPDPASIEDPVKRESAERALQYMGLSPNTPITDIKLDKVFIGSCTNSRIEDLRSAAKAVLAAGAEAKVASHVHAMIVPGSGLVKQQAEEEGLDTIFKRAGFDWREAGCSMCLAMNPDKLRPQERCASTSNRNFQGRQGPGGRTHLVSPAMAAAAALAGHFVDVRTFDASHAQRSQGIDKVRPSLFSEDFSALPNPQPAARETKPTSASSAADAVEKKRFTVLKGVAARLDIENVDTDLIIPGRFLKRMKLEGLKEGLFYALRKDPETGYDTDFILNRPPFDKAKILISTGQNFGCGSSREAAPWSMKEFGIRCVIAPSFGEIFFSNTLQNGMIPIVQPKDVCLTLAEESMSGKELEVDLEKGEIRWPGGKPPINFTIDSFRRHCLLNGLDDIALTLQNADLIEAFERRRRESRPWLDGLGRDRNRRILVGSDEQPAKALDW